MINMFAALTGDKHKIRELEKQGKVMTTFHLRTPGKSITQDPRFAQAWAKVFGGQAR